MGAPRLSLPPPHSSSSGSSFISSRPVYKNSSATWLTIIPFFDVGNKRDQLLYVYWGGVLCAPVGPIPELFKCNGKKIIFYSPTEDRAVGFVITVIVIPDRLRSQPGIAVFEEVRDWCLVISSRNVIRRNKTSYQSKIRGAALEVHGRTQSNEYIRHGNFSSNCC